MLTLLAALAGCAGEGRDGPPDLVLVVVDGFRWDRAHFGGNPRRTTPTLDAFAAEGVRFDRAFSQSNESLYSMASVLTGKYPSEVAVPDYLAYTVPPGALTLAEVLDGFGYETAAFVAGGRLKSAFGFAQGFETATESRDFGSFADTVPLALEWLDRRDRSRPVFVLLHGYDCHRPYVKSSVFHHAFDAAYRGRIDTLLQERNFLERVYDGVFYAEFKDPRALHATGERVIDPSGGPRLAEFAATYEGRRKKALTEEDLAHVVAHYDGALLAADAYVGTFLDALRASPRWEDTLVVVTSDHGEDLHTHGYYNPREVLFDSTTHVPLLLGGGALPEEWRGTVRDEMVDSVDLLPTLAARAGALAPAGTSGRDLWALLGGARDEKDRVFQQGVMGQVSVRTATHRLVYDGGALDDPDYVSRLAAEPVDGGAFALYRSEVDPDERLDVLSQDPDLALELRWALVAWMARLSPGTERHAIPAELEKMLYEKGYW